MFSLFCLKMDDLYLRHNTPPPLLSVPPIRYYVFNNLPCATSMLMYINHQLQGHYLPHQSDLFMFVRYLFLYVALCLHLFYCKFLISLKYFLVYLPFSKGPRITMVFILYLALVQFDLVLMLFLSLNDFMELKQVAFCRSFNY